MNSAHRLPLLVVLLALALFTGGFSHWLVAGETDSPSLNVRDFGATGDGAALDSPSIQKAIDAAHARGGGEVLVPAGNYLSGTILLKDRVTLRLEEGATILGSTQMADYSNPDAFVDAVGQERGWCLIGLIDVKGAAIVGTGTIKGNGEAFRGKRPFLIRCVRSEDIRIEGVRLRDSAAWVCHLFQSRRVTVRGVDIYSHAKPNNDGIDVDSTSDVLIEACTINTGDDAVCIKATSPLPTQNVVVRNCRLRSKWGAFKLGTESMGDFQNIRFADSEIYDTQGGAIKILSMDGCRLENLEIDNITVKNSDMPIFMRLGERLNAYREPKPRTTGHIKGVRISNVTVETAKEGRLAAPTAIVMTGERTEQNTHLIEDVHFKNLKINLEGGGRIESVGTVLERTRNNNYPEYPFFFVEDAPTAFPAYGIYARHVRGVSFENVEITTRQRDTRPLIFLENAHDIQQDGLTSPPAAAAPPAAATPALTIETDARLALVNGPHVAAEITRDRYFRLYHFPGMFDDPLAAELRALRAAPARGTGPYFKDDGGEAGRLNHSNEVLANADIHAAIYRRAALDHPGATHAIAGGSYPTCRPMTKHGAASQTTDATMHVTYDRALEPEQFAGNTEIIATWFDRLAADGVSKPRYFSPYNEPDVSWKTGTDLALKHADFARAVALRLRAAHPDVLVSGPASSWPYPGENWLRWQPSGWERAFIERAGDVAGAYDFHFYTKEFWAYGTTSPGYRAELRQPTPNLHSSLWTGHHQMLDFGKGEALLDLAQSLHLAKWSRPSPPVIISEFGRQGITPQLGPWANDYGYFLYATTVTRLWMMFMDRPEVALTVPFILPVSDIGYGPKRGQALYTRPGAPEDKTPQVTPLRDFYGFFREFEGERVPAAWSGLDPRQAIGIFTIAARRGDTLFVLLHNAAATPLAFDLRLPGPANDAPPVGTTIQRMRWEGTVPTDFSAAMPAGARWRRDLAAAEPVSTSRLELAAEETALLRLPLHTAPARQVVVTRHYAPENLQTLAAERPATFTFTLPPGDLRTAPASADLVFTFAAPVGGQSGQMLGLTINDTELEARPNLGLLEGWKHAVHPFHVAVPAALLRPGKNTLSISPGSGLPADSQVVSARLELRHQAPIRGN
jgi:hypothetical protein